MSQLPSVSGDQTVNALERLGFRRDKQENHHQAMKRGRSDDEVVVVVPLFPRLYEGTLRDILRNAGVSEDEFKRFVY